MLRHFQAKLLFLLLIACTICNRGNSINKIDSLRIVIENTTADSSKAMLYNSLAFQFSFSDPDSAIFYTARSLSICEALINDPGDENNGKYSAIIATSYHNLGVVHYYNSDLIKSLEFNNKARDLREQLVKQFPFISKYKNDLADTYNNIRFHALKFKSVFRYGVS